MRLRLSVKRRTSLVVLFAAMLCVPVSHAQLTTADVLGTVKDKTGAVVPGAKVTITNLGTKISSIAAANDTGDFTFNLLSPGHYSLTFEASGFKRVMVPDFALAAGDRLREDASLELGSAEVTVQVTSTAPLLQTDSSAVQSTVTEQSVQDLPLNGRNYISLVQVQPGVNQGQSNAVSSGTRPDDRRETSVVVANGQADTQNNELLDGLDNNERAQGFIGVRPSIDAIAEVQVTTSNFGAEIGRTAGAVINIVTKSGTNDFHGSAYEFFRNDVFDARDWFATSGVVSKPEYRQNQFGGSIGGPIVKNKTFFFADAEDNRIVQGASSGDLTVPTLYEEQHPGDFSDIGGPVVSTGSLDPVGLAYFKMYPAPNISNTASVNNYTNVVKRPQTTFSTDARIDQHFANNDMLFARYSYNNVHTNIPGWLPDVTEDGVTFNPGYGMPTGLFPGPSTNKVHSIQLSYIHPFTQNLVMQLKAGYARIDIESENVNHGKDVSSAIGVVNANTPAAPETSGLMPLYFTTGGYMSLGDSPFVPILDTNNSFLYSASMLYTHGAHNIKIGAQVTRRQLDYYQSDFPLSWVLFAGLSGNSLADLLQGKALGYDRSNLLYKPGFRAWETGYYVQDDWRLTGSLTVNLGFRYDLFTPISEVQGRSSNFNLPTLTLIQGTADPDIGVRTNHSNYGPRVGFSASILPKIVLRGGYGISYFPADLQAAIQEGNPPNSYSVSCIPSATCGSSFTWPTMPVPATTSTTDLSGALTYKTSNYNSSQVQQFNLMVQRQIGASVITVGGIGELGRHVVVAGGNANEPAPTGPYANDATTGPSAPPSYTTVAELPNVSSISLDAVTATSSYYALQAVFARRLTRGLEFNANYTWAHDLTNGYIGSGAVGGGAAGLLPNDSKYDYGNAEVDIRHRFATTWSYALPFGSGSQGPMAALIKGWHANLVLFWQTGQAFPVTNDWTNAYGVAQINLPDTSTNGDRPDVVAGQSFKASHPSVSSWLNLNAFTPQAAGTAGNEREYQYFGPHTRRADLSLVKNFDFPNRMSVQFRAECYNISNTPNFQPPYSVITGWDAGPNHDATHPISLPSSGPCSVSGACTAVGLLPGDTPTNSGGFGSIQLTATNINPRQFQFALKLLF